MAYELAYNGSARGSLKPMTSSETTTLTSDRAFDILSSQRRRMVLYYLRKHDGTATMNELADQIAAWENEVDIEELSSQQRKRVYVSLYQTHLPKLAETDLVDYDVEEGNVRLTERATEIDTFLTPKQQSSYPWRRHYVGLVLIGGAMVILGLAAIPFFGSTLLILLSVGFIAGYLGTIAVEYWYYRKEQSEIPAELTLHDG